jgi:hypothetical protein
LTGCCTAAGRREGLRGLFIGPVLCYSDCRRSSCTAPPAPLLPHRSSRTSPPTPTHAAFIQAGDGSVIEELSVTVDSASESATGGAGERALSPSPPAFQACPGSAAARLLLHQAPPLLPRPWG